MLLYTAYADNNNNHTKGIKIHYVYFFPPKKRTQNE